VAKEEELFESDDEDVPGVREVTVRSMMGEFGGHAALVSAWWDTDKGRWEIEVGGCDFGVQHIWWAVHIVDFIVALVVLATGVAYVAEEKMDPHFVKRVGKWVKDKIWETKEKLFRGGFVTMNGGLGNGRLEQKHKTAVRLKP